MLEWAKCPICCGTFRVDLPISEDVIRKDGFAPIQCYACSNPSEKLSSDSSGWKYRKDGISKIYPNTIIEKHITGYICDWCEEEELEDN